MEGSNDADSTITSDEEIWSDDGDAELKGHPLTPMIILVKNTTAVLKFLNILFYDFKENKAPSEMTQDHVNGGSIQSKKTVYPYPYAIRIPKSSSMSSLASIDINI